MIVNRHHILLMSPLLIWLKKSPLRSAMLKETFRASEIKVPQIKKCLFLVVTFMSLMFTASQKSNFRETRFEKTVSGYIYINLYGNMNAFTGRKFKRIKMKEK